jgi:hypothetical protein
MLAGEPDLESYHKIPSSIIKMYTLVKLPRMCAPIPWMVH